MRNNLMKVVTISVLCELGLTSSLSFIVWKIIGHPILEPCLPFLIFNFLIFIIFDLGFLNGMGIFHLWKLLKIIIYGQPVKNRVSYRDNTPQAGPAAYNWKDLIANRKTDTFY